MAQCPLWVLVTLSYLTLCDPMDCSYCQVPLSMEFSRQKYWSGLPFPSPGNLPNPGVEPGSPALAGRFFIVWATRKSPGCCKEPSSDYFHYYRCPLDRKEISPQSLPCWGEATSATTMGNGLFSQLNCLKSSIIHLVSSRHMVSRARGKKATRSHWVI